MAGNVSSLSLEGYMQVLEALTGGNPGTGSAGGACSPMSSVVRAVTPIEEHFFKVGDLRQVRTYP
jgi:hypothetical protein